MKPPGLSAILSLGAALWCLPLLLPTRAQSATDLNLGEQVQVDPVNQIYTLSWWGTAGWTYFIQESDDLVNWSWVPVIESGNNAVIEWGFTSNASRLFFRIVANNTPTSDPSTADFDGDGISNWAELLAGSSPLDYYSQPGTSGPIEITPAIAITGNNQTTSPGATTPLPLVVQVTNSNGGAVLANAPVTFTVTSGGGQVAGPTPDTLGASYSLVTDSNGHAQVYYQQPNTNGVASTITASTGGQSVTFTETTTAGDGAFDAPSDVLVVYGGPQRLNISWVNHATSATGILIEQSTDGGATWTTTAALSDPTATSYSAGGLTDGVLYSFRVAPTK